MVERDPESEEEKPAALRSVAVEALQSAARQNDPNEFDRLTRYALALIERARVIRQDRLTVWDGNAPPSQRERRTQRTEDPSPLRKSTAELINKLRRLYSWKIER